MALHSSFTVRPMGGRAAADCKLAHLEAEEDTLSRRQALPRLGPRCLWTLTAGEDLATAADSRPNLQALLKTRSKFEGSE